jgi:hypothetical protein
MSDERFIRTEERRAFPRWPAKFTVVCRDASGVATCRVTDISESGIAFTGEKDYAIGAEIDVEYRLNPNHCPIQVRAMVRNKWGNRTGVEFLNLTVWDRLRILQFETAKAAAVSA